MARIRQAESNHLPKYVMRRGGRYYFEPKGILRDMLGGKASYPLGRSYGEMHQEYMRITKETTNQETQNHTFSELVNEYLGNVSAVRKAASSYKTDVKISRVILRIFAGFAPDEIRTKHIYLYQNQRRLELHKHHKDRYAKKLKEKYFNAPQALIPDSPLEYFGNRTVNKEVSFISSVMKYATQIGVIEQSPCSGIKYLPVEPRRRYITDEELAAFCKFARQKSALLAAYIKFRYVTGRRDCETLSLRFEHVKPEGIIFYIAKKSGRGIRTPVLQEWNDAFKEAYQELADAARMSAPTETAQSAKNKTSDGGYVVCSKKGTRYTSDGWSGLFNRVMNAAIAEKVLEARFTLHDIRSKTATDIDNLADAANVLAHYDTKTTRKHYRIQIERIKAHDAKIGSRES